MPFVFRSDIPLVSDEARFVATDGLSKIVVSSYYTVWTSSDSGSTWLAVEGMEGAVTFGGGVFAFVGRAALVGDDFVPVAGTSSDGITWSLSESAVALEYDATDFIFSAGVFYATDGETLIYSSDGVNYSLASRVGFSGFGQARTLVPYPGGAAAATNTGLIYSTNGGATWQFVEYTNGDRSFGYGGISKDATGYVALDYLNRRIYYSTNAVSWTAGAQHFGTTDSRLYFAGETFYASPDAATDTVWFAGDRMATVESVEMPFSSAWAFFVEVGGEVISLSRTGAVALHSVPYVAALPMSVSVVAPIGIYSQTLGLSVFVADSRVFDSAVGAVSWALRVVIGGVDVSARLTGEIRIDAEEDSARVATLSLIPSAGDQLSALECAEVLIDVTVTGGGYNAARRRFTGVVESVRFDAASRVASLSCRDGYQDRIRAAGSADAVRTLLGGLDNVSPKISTWNDDEPDPAGYFDGALGTVPGATFIDGSGSWRVVPWHIGAPARSYTAADMFDPGPVVETAQRADLPSAVVATLTHRFHRLHNVEVSLSWQEPERVNYVTRGLPPPMKSMVAQALENLGDWVVKGNPVLESPTPGMYPVIVSPTTIYYDLGQREAPLMIRSLSATIYRRWYQEVERIYRVTVDLGGLSGRDESVSRGIRSTFDSSGWESGRRSEPSLGIYSANAPAGSEDDPEPTGYEALQEPWPPSNGAVDHFGDLSASDVQQACRHVIAEATRRAAQWRRRQRVSFERPVDLRLEIGDVAGFDAHGVAGKGQLAIWSERYDVDAGACVGNYTFAAPVGVGSETAYSANIEIPAPTIVHAPLAPALDNWIGADSSTPAAWVNPDTIAGYLCNTLPTSDFYNSSRPIYETQFRIVLPEISETVRDPATETFDIAATINLADAGLTIDF